MQFSRPRKLLHPIKNKRYSLGLKQKALTIGIEVKTFQFGEHIHISDVLEGFVMQVEAIVHFRGGVVGSLIALA